ncbi:NAD(P)-dependent dehydrogenase (short-subunit alcohol dehydrogenase family) [Spinactinospora alkalitolerans]|uniref:NAD(P)-dependent dehydrogenase (Short-subunit alcohol dehydrogenase family) n=1 Tax=Spinactinospora alkalitolerans TaxID=687207 RepID=A0A852TUC9_9ACTN|nr:SDR family oxidoreductase [Spinactinospora alkalitolerans]NYE47639.1 NAD(P)-dependent dehydrogenase (short-subunit alcohol dehydrogenase family) [Spinactinospora alkalitolerans]
MAVRERVAVVTGAGSGIGRSAALALLADGYAVALAGRRADPLAETVRLAGGDGHRALVAPTDVGDPGAVRALFAAVADRFGRVDVLFNNAGAMPPPTPLEEVTDEAWRSVVDVNLTGAFLCAREAFSMMRGQDPQGGRIINNGSVSAHAPRPGSIGYTATKHAVTGLTKSISLEGRRHGIACGQIDIGNAATGLTANIAAGTLQADGGLAPEPTFDAVHAAEAVRYMAGLPLEANVQFLTITATAMPYIGRG